MRDRGAIFEISGTRSAPLLRGQQKIEQHDVRLQRPRFQERLLRCARFVDRSHIALLLQAAAEPGREEGMVVDGEDVDQRLTSPAP